MFEHFPFRGLASTLAKPTSGDLVLICIIKSSKGAHAKDACLPFAKIEDDRLTEGTEHFSTKRDGDHVMTSIL